MTKFARMALAGTVVLAATTAAQAQRVPAHWVGLLDGNRIVHIDGRTAKVAKPVALTGIDGTVVGIDVRPANGKLYALTLSGGLYTVDPKTGTATRASQLDKAVNTGLNPVVDFNPVADRLRVLGIDGASYRINVDSGQVAVDGSLKYDAGDAAAGKTPMVQAGAYSNSIAGTKETGLYDIDTTLGTFLVQAPPNDGVLKTRGSLGIKASAPLAFDIVTDGAGGNLGYLVAGKTLYTVDIASGKATKKADLAGLRGALRDLAALPTM
ncbi:DUF4394 domain-containing protein [Elstera cyanobacteriorum]|uniref:DUF4394 domain-containing protein n=1 Tax=Elstera cyanobacteriorum TaxID=2022747 RepID=UPI002355B0E9|nr:DUF4394 domain-containing protein [Elstera cyanobacteriorum]MCK6441151.1 DUF4394 domain-containing protein [Elstera cyanobacteriorum]